MNELGNLFAQILFDYPVLWPLYALGLWQFIVRPMLRERGEARLAETTIPEYRSDTVDETAAPTGREEHQQFGESAYNELLRRTQKAWTEGALDPFSEQARETGATLAGLMKEFAPHKEAIRFAFKDKPPEDDEFLVAAENAGVLCSFVITNRYFYFFGLDQEFMSNNYGIGKIAYPAIDRIDIKEGWIKNHITFHLSSGETLLAKDLPSDAPGRYLRLRVEQA